MVDLIVKSNIKKAVPEMNVASDVAEILNKKAQKILDEAVERAKANGRRTLQGKDL